MVAPDGTGRDAVLPASVWRSSGPHGFSPLVSWLVATARPDLTVEIGPGDEASLASTCDAVRRTGSAARCAVVLGRGGDGDDAAADRAAFGHVVDKLRARFGDLVEAYDGEQACRDALDGRHPDLLHLALSETARPDEADIDAWLDTMSPGAVMVITTAGQEVSSHYAETTRLVSQRLPSVAITLGLASEALVAQRPTEDGTPIVDALAATALTVAPLLALVGERDALVAAVRAYQEEASRLSLELTEVRGELARQHDAAREEREHLVREFLDRVDHLSSKISTSAAHYSALLAEKEQLIEAQERRVEAYAGIAANTQSALDDIRGSTSWRITAPIRIFSRALARRSATPRWTRPTDMT